MGEGPQRTSGPEEPRVERLGNASRLSTYGFDGRGAL